MKLLLAGWLADWLADGNDRQESRRWSKWKWMNKKRVNPQFERFFFSILFLLFLSSIRQSDCTAQPRFMFHIRRRRANKSLASNIFPPFFGSKLLILDFYFNKIRAKPLIFYRETVEWDLMWFRRRGWSTVYAIWKRLICWRNHACLLLAEVRIQIKSAIRRAD